MKNNLGTLQTFSIWSDNATKQNRVDVEYYQPYFDYLVEKVSKTKFELKKLDEIAEFIGNGRTPAKDKYVEDGEQENAKPIIKAGTASGKFVNLDKLGYAHKDFLTGAIAQKGDIFVLSAAHQAQYVGKNVSILENEPPADTSFVGELICVRADTSQCLPEYLFSILSSETGYLLLNREKRGQTSHIYPSDIKEILLPVPSLDEQRKIITAFNNAYAEKRKKEAKAKEILKSIDDFLLGELGIKLEPEKEQMTFEVLSDEITNRIDPSFYLPLNFSLSGFDEIQNYASVQGGFAFKSNEYVDDGIPLVRIQNLSNGDIDLTDTVHIKSEYKNSLERFLLNDNDLLIAMTGATIGKTAKIHKNNLPAFLNQRVGRFVVGDKIDEEYLYIILQTSIFTEQLKRLALGGAQPNISPESICKIKIPIPAINKQKKITQIATEKRVQARTLLAKADELVANAQKQVEQMILS